MSPSLSTAGLEVREVQAGASLGNAALLDLVTLPVYQAVQSRESNPISTTYVGRSDLAYPLQHLEIGSKEWVGKVSYEGIPSKEVSPGVPEAYRWAEGRVNSMWYLGREEKREMRQEAFTYIAGRLKNHPGKNIDIKFVMHAAARRFYRFEARTLALIGNADRLSKESRIGYGGEDMRLASVARALPNDLAVVVADAALKESIKLKGDNIRMCIKQHIDTISAISPSVGKKAERLIVEVRKRNTLTQRAIRARKKICARFNEFCL